MHNLTIAEIANEHYLPEKRSRRRANTVEGYESSLNLHVIPRWGTLRIDEIDPDAIQLWVDELAPEIGPGGAEKAYKCLRQVVRWAIRKFRMFVADPTVGIEMPRKPLKKTQVLTPRRLKRLVRGFVGYKDEPTLIISAALGVRLGENYFLHWEDINWRTGEVPIKGTLQEAYGELWEYEPKTAKSERDCFLPPWALDRLHQIWVERGRPRGRIIGDRRPSCVAQSVKRWIKKLRLPKITMENLRHTWGSIAANAGVAIQTVAAMMGHSTIQTTYRYYYALSAATAKRAQRKVARSVLGKTVQDMYKGLIIPLVPVMQQAA